MLIGIFRSNFIFILFSSLPLLQHSHHVCDWFAVDLNCDCSCHLAQSLIMFHCFISLFYPKRLAWDILSSVQESKLCNLEDHAVFDYLTFSPITTRFKSDSANISLVCRHLFLFVSPGPRRVGMGSLL